MITFPRETKVNLGKCDDDVIFQIVSWYANDHDTSESEEEGDRMLIKVYGVKEDGTSVSLNILNFTPFFFIKVSHSIDSLFMQRLQEFMVTKLPATLRNSFVDVKFLKKKEFWGFTNDTTFNFIRFTFKSIAAFRAGIRIISQKIMIPGCKYHGKDGYRYKIYESNIEPMIRFMHIKDISPSGWVKVPGGKYNANNGVLPTNCQIDIECDWKSVLRFESDKISPSIIASFDLECTSSHGDFPVARKDYKKLAFELMQAWNEEKISSASEVVSEIVKAFQLNVSGLFSKVYVKDQMVLEPEVFDTKILPKLKRNADDIVNILRGRLKFDKNAYVSVAKMTKDEIIRSLTMKLGSYYEEEDKEKRFYDKGKKIESWIGIFPKLEGDPIIQIGTTVHKYGESDCSFKHILTLGSCDPIEGVVVEACETEEELLLKWRDLIVRMDPDIMTGYNIFGFDMAYLYDRARELGIETQFCKIGKVVDHKCKYEEKKLSSSALGDNLLKYIDMDGRVLIDIMKVVQRDHKLDSYKLDLVASHFMKMNKNDVSPNDIFKLQKGTSADRKVVAEYCVQDCALCNKLMMKLEILANNNGMANVCNVPLSYIFMRGQGVKIFSLVAKFCRENDMMIPTISRVRDDDAEQEDEDGYEGAIVLPPKQGIYLDRPVNVWDYASLYPSSMIAENLSHDRIVLDPKYDNLEGVVYNTVSYDIYEGIGDKKRKVGVKECKFVQDPDNGKGVIPRILQRLLKARKDTRKKIEYQTVVCKNGESFNGLLKENECDYEVKTIDGKANTVAKEDVVEIHDTYNDFEKAVLDGLQLAYKVTANSLYGQIGARTSPIYLKDIAACTTATGRNMIMLAKEFMEKHYNADIIYGDTDSIFAILPSSLRGKDALMPSIATAIEASDKFKPLLKAPHDLEYEKTFWPFILFSKKRYVGNLYEHDDKKFKQKSMGIVLKRRDNANIVKQIYGGCIDIIMNQQDIQKSVEFLGTELQQLVDGHCPMDQLVITKSLKSEYKNPDQIAHKVLAERMGERDPGNKPQVNDRIPFIYIQQPIPKKGEKILQGNRIEHPDYIKQNNLKPDYEFYITNQIMKPVLQLYALTLDSLKGYDKPKKYFIDLEKKLMEEKDGDIKKVKDKLDETKEKIVKELLFDPALKRIQSKYYAERSGNRQITDFFKVG